MVVLTSGYTNPDQAEKLAGDYHLFIIDRSRDSIFEPLTGIQKKFGYGIKFQHISEHSADFKFVSSLDRIFELRKSGDNHYKVYTYSEGNKVEVKSLFIHFEDDSFWFPTISSIELAGLDTEKGSRVSESIIP